MISILILFSFFFGLFVCISRNDGVFCIKGLLLDSGCAYIGMAVKIFGEFFMRIE